VSPALKRVPWVRGKWRGRFKVGRRSSCPRATAPTRRLLHSPTGQSSRPPIFHLLSPSKDSCRSALCDASRQALAVLLPLLWGSIQASWTQSASLPSMNLCRSAPRLMQVREAFAVVPQLLWGLIQASWRQSSTQLRSDFGAEGGAGWHRLGGASSHSCRQRRREAGWERREALFRNGTVLAVPGRLVPQAQGGGGKCSTRAGGMSPIPTLSSPQKKRPLPVTDQDGSWRNRVPAAGPTN